MADQEDAANIIVPTQEPAASHSPTCIKLSAADYTLGALDFGTPPLSQNHKPSVTSCTMGPLAFSMPAWDYGVIHWMKAGSAFGRPPDIPPSLEPVLIAKMKRWLIEKQAKVFHRLTREDPVVMEYARKLAADAGIETSDSTLLRRLIRPAFPSIEPKT